MDTKNPSTDTKNPSADTKNPSTVYDNEMVCRLQQEDVGFDYSHGAGTSSPSH